MREPGADGEVQAAANTTAPILSNGSQRKDSGHERIALRPMRSRVSTGSSRARRYV